MHAESVCRLLIWLMWICQFDTVPIMQQTFYQQEQLFYIIRGLRDRNGSVLQKHGTFRCWWRSGGHSVYTVLTLSRTDTVKPSCHTTLSPCHPRLYSSCSSAEARARVITYAWVLRVVCLALVVRPLPDRMMAAARGD